MAELHPSDTGHLHMRALGLGLSTGFMWIYELF